MMKFSCAAISLQIIFIVLFATLAEYDKKENTSLYPMFQDVHVMVFVGFGFLMTFLRRYSFGAVGYNFFISALAIQWYLIVHGCIKHRGETGFDININIGNLVTADFSAAAVLITFGAVLGKVNRFQLLVIAMIEIVMFTVNEFILLEELKIADAGGSLVIHCFGAYFGMALSLVLSLVTKRPRGDHPKEGSVYHSDVFAMIGTLFLWMYWPSFNSVLVAPGLTQQRALVNTYLSLVAACVTTFAVSGLVNKDRKLDMVHVQNATLAGGVAVGTCANMVIEPWGAILIGFLAGIISTVGYAYITPFLKEKFHLHDTCGVHNLHGMPALLAGVAGAVAAKLADADKYDGARMLSEVFPDIGNGRSSAEQGGYQAAAIFVTLAISIVSGAITGFIVSLGVFDPPEDDQLFEDGYYWELPEVYVVKDPNSIALEQVQKKEPGDP